MDGYIFSVYITKEEQPLIYKTFITNEEYDKAGEKAIIVT